MEVLANKCTTCYVIRIASLNCMSMRIWQEEWSGKVFMHADVIDIIPLKRKFVFQ